MNAKHVQVGWSGDRTRISLAVFMCADGTFIEPVVLLKGSNSPQSRASRKSMFAGWTSAPFILTEAATMTESSFGETIRYFSTHPRVKKGSLLVVDNHSSRVSMEALEMLRTAGMDMHSICAHASHTQNPFDVAAAASLTTNMRKSVDEVRLGAPGRPGVTVTQANIMPVIKAAFHRTMAASFDPVTGHSNNICSVSFAKAGIHPWRPDCTEKELFGPSSYYQEAVVNKRAPPSSPEKLAAVKAQTDVIMESGDITAALATAAKRKRKGAVPEHTLLTGDEHCLKIVVEIMSKLDEEAAVVQRKLDKKAARLAKKKAMGDKKAAAAAKKADKVPKKKNGAAAAVAAAPAASASVKRVKKARAVE